MNYNDSILENKAFSFFKQLVYNIALAICVLLLLTIILVYGFKFKLYNVMSDSEAPIFTRGDMVVVKEQKEYKVGDIIQFDHGFSDPVAHRLIDIKKDEATGKVYYICHGDAVGSSNPDNDGETRPWKEESAYIKSLTLEEVRDTNKAFDIQITTEDKIMGKVVCWFANYGNYFTFIQKHELLVIAIVVGIWCINGVIQNELDMRKFTRFEA